MLPTTAPTTMNQKPARSCAAISATTPAITQPIARRAPRQSAFFGSVVMRVSNAARALANALTIGNVAADKKPRGSHGPVADQTTSRIPAVDRHADGMQHRRDGGAGT